MNIQLTDALEEFDLRYTESCNQCQFEFSKNDFKNEKLTLSSPLLDQNEFQSNSLPSHSFQSHSHSRLSTSRPSNSLPSNSLSSNYSKNYPTNYNNQNFNYSNAKFQQFPFFHDKKLTLKETTVEKSFNLNEFKPPLKPISRNSSFSNPIANSANNSSNSLHTLPPSIPNSLPNSRTNSFDGTKSLGNPFYKSKFESPSKKRKVDNSIYQMDQLKLSQENLVNFKKYNTENKLFQIDQVGDVSDEPEDEQSPLSM